MAVMTRLWAEYSRLDFQLARRYFLCHHDHSYSEAHPTLYPVSCRSYFPGAKELGHEAYHSRHSNAEVKNAQSYTSGSLYVFMASCLIRYRDNFILTSYKPKLFPAVCFVILTDLFLDMCCFYTSKFNDGCDIMKVQAQANY